MRVERTSSSSGNGRIVSINSDLRISILKILIINFEKRKFKLHSCLSSPPTTPFPLSLLNGHNIKYKSKQEKHTYLVEQKSKLSDPQYLDSNSKIISLNILQLRKKNDALNFLRHDHHSINLQFFVMQEVWFLHLASE